MRIVILPALGLLLISSTGYGQVITCTSPALNTSISLDTTTLMLSETVGASKISGYSIHSSSNGVDQYNLPLISNAQNDGLDNLNPGYYPVIINSSGVFVGSPNYSIDYVNGGLYFTGTYTQEKCGAAFTVPNIAGKWVDKSNNLTTVSESGTALSFSYKNGSSTGYFTSPTQISAFGLVGTVQSNGTTIIWSSNAGTWTKTK